ncbi:MAG: acyltransferase family protein [Arachnia sp.]
MSLLTATSSPQASTATGAKDRTPFWDNGRWLLMVLVILGHSLDSVNGQSNAVLGAYVWIYSFHMPAFAVLSGYFSRATPPSPARMTQLVTDLLIPYFVFDTIWFFVKWAVRGDQVFDPTAPGWTLWYLLALALFRLALPYLALLRWPLAWAVAASVIVGYLPAVDTTFSMSRAVALLPFFALGWWVKDRALVDRWKLLGPRPWWVPVVAVAVLATTAWAAWHFADLWREVRLTEWLYYRSAYEAMGVEQWWAGGVRLLLIGIAVVVMSAFLALVPRRAYRWTHFGQASMYIYLLHTFVLFGFREAGMLDHLEPAWIWLPSLLLAAVLIAMGLATRPIRALFWPLVEPRPAFLFAEPSLVRRRPRPSPTSRRRSRSEK